MCGLKVRNLCARFALAAAVLASASAPAHAETEPLAAQLDVVSPGSFFKIADLNFGTVVASNATGTVTITPAGVRSATGGVTLWGNDHHPAQFAGMKPTAANRPVRMRVGSNSINLTGPGAPMTVSLFRANTSPAQVLTTTPRNFQVQQASNGAFALFVGATLNVNANQAPGTYTGTWTLTLDYQ
jgi:spore coat protein U-like protein